MIIKQVITVASYTIKESLYNKIIQLSAGILILTFTISYFLTDLMIGSRLKVLMDFSLLSYQLFGFCFILFFVIPFFSKPQRLKTLSLFLVKPIYRSTFLFGVFVGFTIILFISSIFFYTASLIYLWYISGFFMPHLFLAFLSIFFESLFLTSSAILLSLLLPNLLSYICLFAIYIIAYSSHSWLMLITKKASAFWAFIAYITYYGLPDLSLLDIKSQIIYQLPLNTHSFVISILYTISTTSLLLAFSFIVFKRKNI